MDYLKVSKATDLTGRDRKLYRFFEIIPGFFSWTTLLLLLFFSWIKPVWAAYFIIAFNIYWLLLVVYLGIHLVSSYFKLKNNLKINWKEKCFKLSEERQKLTQNCLANQGFEWNDLIHLVILPTYNESLEIVRGCVQSVVENGYPLDKIIVVLAIEERAGNKAKERANLILQEYGDKFKHFLISEHPDNIEGEIKGKGANQCWAAKQVRKKIIDPNNYDYGKILVSVFDIDTEARSGYFYNLSYKFLTVENPYHASYQPVPFYHNNIWEAPFFARVAASSNTFWQMMQQIREEKLATYSSHSMTWKALLDIGFWSTNMVSEDSRITWHCFCYYNGNYRVEPLHFPVSMDVTMDVNFWATAKSLYKQQRRWGWGVENAPYLLFNTIKRWKTIDRKKAIGRIFVQIYGFHSWATNALIIAVIGWMPMLLGGDKFNATVLSVNLPIVSRTLMTFAMGGLILSAILSTLLLPKNPNKSFLKYLIMFFQWLALPFSIIFFGAIPGLEAQSRLMFGKYMGFWITPKKR